MYSVSFAILSLLLAFASRESSCSTRIKRVINGVTFNGRPTNYRVIRYYAALGTTHGVSFYHLWFGEVKPGEVICGGVLISATIYQTACHCVSLFDVDAHWGFLAKPKLKNHWETSLVVYAGVSYQYDSELSMAKTPPVPVWRFAIHQKCGLLGGDHTARGGTSWTFVTHNYGVVQLDPSWIKRDSTFKYQWTEMLWAPSPTVPQLEYSIARALEKQLVCMHIGFGAVSTGNDGSWDELGVTSNELRHGWSVLQPQTFCTYLTARKDLWFWRDLSEANIKLYMSWSCTGKFPKHDQMAGKTDLGSPLTCDAMFIATLGGPVWWKEMKGEDVKKWPVLDYYKWGYEGWSSLYHTLNFNSFVNAIEYRHQLELALVGPSIHFLPPVITTREPCYATYDRPCPTVWERRN